MPSSRCHTAFGITGILLVIQPDIEYEYIDLISGAILGSMLPDIDTQKSWVSQVVPLVDDVARAFGLIHHRCKITHSIFTILFFGLLYFILGIWYNTGSYFLLALFVGVTSHIFLDWFTYEIIRVRCSEHKSQSKKLRKKTAIIDQQFFTSLHLYRFIWIMNTLLFLRIYFNISWEIILAYVLIIIEYLFKQLQQFFSYFVSFFETIINYL